MPLLPVATIVNRVCVCVAASFGFSVNVRGRSFYKTMANKGSRIGGWRVQQVMIVLPGYSN